MDLIVRPRGRLELGGVRDLGLELLGREVAAVGVGERQAVLVDVVAVGALDLLDLVDAAGDNAHHVDPVDVLHAAAGDGAAGLLGQRVEAVDLRRGGGPGVDGLLAGGDHVDAARDALLHVVVDVADEAEEGHDGDVGVALVEDLVGVVGDDDARLDAETGEVAHVLAHDGRVHVDGAHDLRAVLVQVAQDVLGHLSAPVLDDLDLLHGSSLRSRGRPLRPTSGPTLVPGYRFQGRGLPAGATRGAARGPDSDASGMAARRPDPHQDEPTATPGRYYMELK